MPIKPLIFNKDNKCFEWGDEIKIDKKSKKEDE